MKANIFRQVALERLSSPDQLDELLRVTKSHTWFVLVGIFVLLTVTAVWAYEGSIPTTVDGKGVIVRTGGVLNIAAQGTGMIVELNVRVGDKVREKQVIARIAQPDLLQRIRTAKDVLGDARRERERLLE